MDCQSPSSSSGRVTVRDLDDPRTKELVISSADATGLGVDVARVLFAFGLSVLFCDLSADSTWAYLVFRVRESDDVNDRVDWIQLAEKLEATCPSDGDALAAMSHIAMSEIDPYVVKVAGFDRPGLLWRISKAFWQLDCSVFKAHVSTDETGNVVDSFWIHDNKGSLPSPERALEISDHLMELLGENVDVSIAPAPSQTQVVPKNICAAFGSGFTFFEGERLRRLACKDATSHSNLRSLVIKNHVAQKHWSSSDSLCSSRSGSGSVEDMLFMAGATAGGGNDRPHGHHAGSGSASGSDVFNNNTIHLAAGGSVSASPPGSLLANRHKRMSSILMESPEKQVDVVSGDAAAGQGFIAGAGTHGVDNVAHATSRVMMMSLDPFKSTTRKPSPMSMLAKNACSLSTGSVDTNNHMNNSPLQQHVSAGSKSVMREFDDAGHVSIEADMHTSSEYILLTINCQNRKGILYDIFVALKEIRVRVANCRTWMIDDDSERVCIELMVQDAYGGDVCSAETANDQTDSAQILVERMREAIAKSVTILLGRGRREGQYKLMVVAMVDAGGRGRPRVTYDVTKLFATLGLSITECDVFVEEGLMDEDESFEVHKYVFEPNMKSLRLTDGDMQTLADAVARSLQGRGGALPKFDYEQKDEGDTVQGNTNEGTKTGTMRQPLSASTESWIRLLN